MSNYNQKPNSFAVMFNNRSRFRLKTRSFELEKMTVGSFDAWAALAVSVALAVVSLAEAVAHLR